MVANYAPYAVCPRCESTLMFYSNNSKPKLLGSGFSMMARTTSSETSNPSSPTIWSIQLKSGPCQGHECLSCHDDRIRPPQCLRKGYCAAHLQASISARATAIATHIRHHEIDDAQSLKCGWSQCCTHPAWKGSASGQDADREALQNPPCYCSRSHSMKSVPRHAEAKTRVKEAACAA